MVYSFHCLVADHVVPCRGELYGVFISLFSGSSCGLLSRRVVCRMYFIRLVAFRLQTSRCFAGASPSPASCLSV